MDKPEKVQKEEILVWAIFVKKWKKNKFPEIMITANNNTLFYKMQVNQIFICLGPSGYIDGIDGCWRRYII